MPIHIHWDNDTKTILRHDFEGNWTWDEYFELVQKRNTHMASVDHHVDVIANMKPGIMPSGFALSSAKTSLRSAPPNHGLFVIVTNTVISTFLDLFKQFDRETGLILREADSVEEAREIIRLERQKNSNKDKQR